MKICKGFPTEMGRAYYSRVYINQSQQPMLRAPLLGPERKNARPKQDRVDAKPCLQETETRAKTPECFAVDCITQENQNQQSQRTPKSKKPSIGGPQLLAQHHVPCEVQHRHRAHHLGQTGRPVRDWGLTGCVTFAL